jgi:O-antigen ligase
MMRKSFAKVLNISVTAFLLVAFLFADAVWGSAPGFVGSILREITAIFRDPETQWMVFLCLGIYFTAFLFLRSRAERNFTQRRKDAKESWCLVYVLCISAVLYAIHYSSSMQALTLLGGAGVGQGMAVWVDFEARSQKSEVRISFEMLVISLLVILLALASVWQTDAGHIFEYHSHARWTGPWDNPNIFGLLMGTGAALAAGIGMRGWSRLRSASPRQGMEDGRRKSGIKQYVVGILCLIAAVFMARGLLHSYSRGAWLATFCGLAYLVSSCFILHSSFPRSSWLKNNWLPLFVILASVFVLVFWHFRQTEWHPAHRAFSAVNAADFSWRNRIAAWEGALQMMAEKPWFGFGWNQPEPLYEHYYLPPKLTESAAIQMNDYLLLGTTLGIPALFCFGMYIWRSLMRSAECGVRNSGNGDRQDACPTLDLLPATCRAGAIVLLVGFWFDGGLFKLPTAATFWILLELGSVGSAPPKAAAPLLT